MNGSPGGVDVLERSKSTTNGRPFPGVRTVAIVVAALGAEAGGTILSLFSESEVEAIVREVKDMPSVPAAEVHKVISRLRDEAVAQSYAVAGGLDKARQLLRRSHGADADAILDQILAATAALPFEFLRGRPPEQIVNFLTSEHPQVIALVVAHLPTSTAAKVIEGLPADLRALVAARYANLEAIDNEVLAEIERSMLKRVGARTLKAEAAHGGVKPLAQLLNNVNSDTEKAVLGDLERIEPALALAVRDLMFVFEDIIHIDDRGLQEVLRAADARTIAVALRDAAAPLRDKIERNLSQRAGEDVKESASSLGMVRRSDVAAAQRQIIEGARKLEEEGRIVLVRGGASGGDFV